MDYQKYAFELLANSDLRGLEFRYDATGCPYPSSVGPDRLLEQDVLDALKIGNISYGAWGEHRFEGSSVMPLDSYAFVSTRSGHSSGDHGDLPDLVSGLVYDGTGKPVNSRLISPRP